MADDIDQNEMAQAVLEHLLVVAVGQTPRAAVTTKMVAAVERVFAKLEPRGLAPFSVDAIPPEAQDEIRDIVASVTCVGFGVPPDRVAILQSAAIDARTRLAEQYEDDKLTDEDQQDTGPDYF